MSTPQPGQPIESRPDLLRVESSAIVSSPKLEIPAAASPDPLPTGQQGPTISRAQENALPSADIQAQPSAPTLPTVSPQARLDRLELAASGPVGELEAIFTEGMDSY